MEQLGDKLGFSCISTTKEERDAGFLSIVVTKRSERAIGFACGSRIGDERVKYGITLDSFSASEMWLRNGGAHCMTCPVLVS